MNLLRATVELTHRNTRRYGGYLVHMGIVLMFIGFTGHAFNQSEVKELKPGRHHAHRPLRAAHGQPGAGRERQLPLASRHHPGVQGRPAAGHVQPEKRLYKASKAEHFRGRHPERPTRTCT
jgi:cytochrome c-type biogenesis protein CcmF